MLYVYAITNASRPPAVGGLRGADLVLVEEDGLAAVVSELERAPEPGEDTLWEHETAVEAAMDEGDLLPMRFGATVRDEEEIRALMRRRHDEWAEALDRVGGAVELSVRALLAAEPEQEPVAVGEGAAAPSGTTYMRRRVEESQLARDLSARIHEPLASLSRAARRRVSGAGALKSAYLVERETVDAFKSRVEELSRDLEPVSVTCTGPWPPYSFVGGGTGR